MQVSQAQVMNKLQQSATGRKLLEEAQKKGVKINFAANNGDNIMGQYNPNNNTITVEGNSIEKMVETLGHELVHATTRENGNSMQEEKSAFIIGEKIAAEAGVNATPHDASFWSNHVDKAYSGLAQDNGIAGKLNALGITTAGNNIATGNKAAGGNQAAAGNIFQAVNNLDAAINTANNNFAANPAAPVPPAQANPFGAAQQNPNANPADIQGMLAMIMQLLQSIMQYIGGQNNPNANPNANPQQNLINFQGFNQTA